MDTPRKVLIVYYSLTGNTARVANDLARELNADVEALRDHTPRIGSFGLLRAAFDALRNARTRIDPPQRDPVQYDLTIVGTPVWASHITPAVRTYLQQMQHRIGRIAFFATCANTGYDRITPALERAANRKAITSTTFNARELSDSEAYREKLAAFVRAISSAPGDHTRRVA